MSSAAVVLLRGRPTAGCCFFKACTGRIVCGCATRPVQASSSAGCVCLQRPCFAMLCLQPPLPCHAYCPRHFLPRSVLHFPCPLFIAMCARIVEQFAGTALMAAATRDCTSGPCTVVCLYPSISCVHCVCYLSWHGDCVAQLMRRCVHCVCHLSWHGDCGCAAHAPLCSLRPF